VSCGGTVSHKQKDSHVQDKIRQQLQVLRDLGYLEFSERGEVFGEAGKSRVRQGKQGEAAKGTG
jgi:ribosomal protein S19E (S16A)